MSSSRATRSAPPTVERRYAPSPDACARAVAVLLEHPPGTTKAAELRPEPDGCNNAAIVTNNGGGESCRATTR